MAAHCTVWLGQGCFCGGRAPSTCHAFREDYSPRVDVLNDIISMPSGFDNSVQTPFKKREVVLRPSADVGLVCNDGVRRRVCGSSVHYGRDEVCQSSIFRFQ